MLYVRDLQGIHSSFESYLTVSYGSSYSPFHKVYGLALCCFSHWCKLEADRAGAELHAMSLAGPLLPSAEVNLCPHRILESVCLMGRKFSLPLALWDRCGDTKPGCQVVVLHGIFSSKFCHGPSPHHSLLKHMIAKFPFKQFYLMTKLKCVVQVLSIN